MPSGAVKLHDGEGAGLHGATDLGEVEVHGLDVDHRQNHGGTGATLRTNRAEDVCPFITLIAWGARPGTFLGPDIGQAALLADPGLVLKPDFDRLAAGMLGDDGGKQFGEVFLCVSWAAGSCPGCCGRTEMR